MEKSIGRGDVVWLEFSGKGHEQLGRRPALVLSPTTYNDKVGLAIVCPITKHAKGYPFEIPIRGKITGVVLVDQVRSLDWKARKAKKAMRVTDATIGRVSRMLELLLP